MARPKGPQRIGELERLRAENRSLRRHQYGTNLTKVLQSLFKWSSVLGIAYYAHIVFLAWAGKTTVANIRLDAHAYASLDTAASGDIWPAVEAVAKSMCATAGDYASLAFWVAVISLLAGVMGLVYGKAQKRLRNNAIAKLSPYQQKYEKLIDPQRSSSSLTMTGETRLEDE